ncbi:unnamed protein product [Phytomonas sp. Hart1]|nr:unnamed protein product [Phytomonas sp. Hart1]|eukprot:CCW66493.1 unnamed protein product [Phytomonas sp. isolate Hart1]
MFHTRNPSTRHPHLESINLDNLETLQDRWAKQNASSRCPLPSPELNSPRSLAACRRCGVDPSKDLEKLSLLQHLLRLSHKLQYVEETVDALSRRLDLKTALQTAVLAFQHTTIGLGTSKEKVVAYMGFLNQEEVRVPRLEKLRRVRRQMIEEEAAEPEGLSNGSTGAAVAMEVSHSHASSQVQHLDHSNDHGMVVSAQTVRSTELDVIPVNSRGLAESLKGKAPDSTLTTPLSHAVTTYTGRYQQFPSSKIPYVPRDAMALNTNYFANRTFKSLEAVSNPSGAPLRCSVHEQTNLVNSRLRIDSGELEEMRNDHAGNNKALSADALRLRSDNRFTEGKAGEASVSMSVLRNGSRGGITAPYALSISQQSDSGNLGIKKDTTEVFSDANLTTSQEGKNSLLMTSSRANFKLSETQTGSSVMETINDSLSSSFTDSCLKQSTTYIPLVYGKELHEPFVYYCANPALLFA